MICRSDGYDINIPVSDLVGGTGDNEAFSTSHCIQLNNNTLYNVRIKQSSHTEYEAFASSVNDVNSFICKQHSSQACILLFGIRIP